MTVGEIAKLLECNVICMPDESREITGGYAGDLLSWVMGRANSGDAWITIMSNVNIVAVATLADPSCIILAEGVVLEEDVKAKAEQQGINVISSKLDTFSLCAEIAKHL